MYHLPCYDSRKSFYGKAKIYEKGNTVYLCSYETVVAAISEGKVFSRLWPGYSATTMRHVNSFLQHFRMSGGGKAWWDAQPVQARAVNESDLQLAEAIEKARTHCDCVQA